MTTRNLLIPVRIAQDPLIIADTSVIGAVDGYLEWAGLSATSIDYDYTGVLIPLLFNDKPMIIEVQEVRNASFENARWLDPVSAKARTQAYGGTYTEFANATPPTGEHSRITGPLS